MATNLPVTDWDHDRVVLSNQGSAFMMGLHFATTHKESTAMNSQSGCGVFMRVTRGGIQSVVRFSIASAKRLL